MALLPVCLCMTLEKRMEIAVEKEKVEVNLKMEVTHRLNMQLQVVFLLQ